MNAGKLRPPNLDRVPAVVLVTLILVAAIAIFFQDVVFANRTLMTSARQPGVMGEAPPYGYPEDPTDVRPYVSDARAFSSGAAPAAESMNRLLQEGEWPLWNENISLGIPALAQASGNMNSPLRLPAYLVPEPLMWDAFFLARLLLGGLGTYWLCRLLGLKWSPSSGAAIVYVFSGYTSLHVETLHADYAMLLPLLLASLENVIQRPAPRSSAISAIVVALLLLADNPQPALLGVGLGLVYIVVRLLATSSAVRRPAFHAATGLVLGCLMGAVVYIPFAELAGFLGFDGLGVHRHPAGHGVGTASAPANTLASQFLPYLYGAPNHTFAGTPNQPLYNYVGVASIFVAVLGLTDRTAKRHVKWFFAGVAALGTAKIYGAPVVNALGEFPLLEVVKYPLYAPPIVNISIAVLVGMGLQRVLVGRTRPTSHRWAWVGTWYAVAMSLWIARGALSAIPSGHLVRQLVVPFAFSLLAVTLGVWIARRERPDHRYVLLLLVPLFLEPFFVTSPVRGHHDLVPEGPYGTNLPVSERPRRHDPFTEPPSVRMLRADPSVHRVVGVKDALFPNSAQAYDEEDVRGQQATSVDRYFRLMKEFVDPTADFRFMGRGWKPFGHEPEGSVLDRRILDLMNVKYVVSPETIRLAAAWNFELVHDGELKVYENREVLPRAFLVHEVDNVQDVEAAVAAMKDPAFDPSRTAVIEVRDPDQAPSVSPATAPEEVEFIRRGPNSLVLRVSSSSPGLLVVTDVFYPGWRVTVDGEERETLPTNAAFRGVSVDAGDHRVEFDFRPTTFQISRLVSGAAALLVLGLLILPSSRTGGADESDEDQRVPASAVRLSQGDEESI